eukprot:203862-Chlamydomonas_euryale.AAC.1
MGRGRLEAGRQISKGKGRNGSWGGRHAGKHAGRGRAHAAVLRTLPSWPANAISSSGWPNKCLGKRAGSSGKPSMRARCAPSTVHGASSPAVHGGLHDQRAASRFGRSPLTVHGKVHDCSVSGWSRRCTLTAHGRMHDQRAAAWFGRSPLTAHGGMYD